MITRTATAAVVLMASIFTASVLQAASMMAVSYGTITGISQQERDTSSGSRGGAIVGGLAGFATGSGRSGSNRALRTLAGGAVGSAAGRTMARGTETVYTVSLINGGTVRIVMEGNFRMGDCVSVERGGGSNNMRRVSSEFCTNNDRIPAQYKAEHRREADECAQATQRLLNAQTDEEIRNAQTIMNILCED